MPDGAAIRADDKAGWTRALVDPGAFAHEQSRLGQVWTLLGLADDVAKDGDWFRSTLGGRSVFVQRFGAELKGFENVCAHRFHPIRTEESGHGPVVCGFHHWRYDAEGRAYGVPLCQDLFGALPKTIGARLRPVEVATCGSLVFGRFNDGGARESLEDYLGEGFPILAALAQPKGRRRFFTAEVKANWRLCMHVSIDDYHVVAVHPSTFGRHGYPDRANLDYFRFGPHSLHMDAEPETFGPRAEALTRMAEACRTGSWVSRDFRVFHIFPNLAVAHFHGRDGNYYVVVEDFQALAHDRTRLRAWVHCANFPSKRPWWDHWPMNPPIRAEIIWRLAKRVIREDAQVCERLQSVAAQVDGRQPVYGRLEERVGWFEEAYAAAVGPLD